MQKRCDKGRRLLTPRDRWVLQWITEQYAIRFDQLRALLSRNPQTTNLRRAPGPQGISASSVNSVLRRWRLEPELAEYRKIFADTPGWIWTSLYSQQLLSLTYARHIIRESTLTHLYWINQVRLDIERRHPNYRWVSERTLRANLPRREEGASVGHIPDAQIWTPERQSIAIEIELSPKSEIEMEEILQSLLIGVAGNPGYQTVWYFVSAANAVNGQARRMIEITRRRLPEELRSRIQIIELEQVG